ncbi:MAG TPA: hypothetical protein DCR93_05485 [Cytophagales bacterium]|nr:hypothetical protein [Cytophagales bacterium]HAP58964.1 hypothetical protein [Cytophagales bacterium]
MDTPLFSADQSNIPVDQDAFQRYPFAKGVANTIQNIHVEDSFVLGIYGRWGEGKSTVLHFVMEELKNQENHLVVEFNPWIFADEGSFMSGLLSLLAEELEVKVRGKEVAKALQDYAGIIGGVGKTFGIGSQNAVANVGEKVGEFHLKRLKRKIGEALISSKKKLVIIIDDIDRLPSSQIHEVFRLVKAVADFKNTRYVLSFDDDVVARALDEIYSEKGHSYLEKVVQLPLPLPKIRQVDLLNFFKQKAYSILQANSIDPETQKGGCFFRTLDTQFSVWLETPRSAVRFANTLSFSLPLVKDEINIQDLLLIETIKILFPDLYAFLRKYALALTKRTAKNLLAFGMDEDSNPSQPLAAFLSDLPEQRKTLYQALIHELFPISDPLGMTDTYLDNLWQGLYQQKRIGSDNYVERYFTYSLSQSELSDVEFNAVIQDLIHEDHSNPKQTPRIVEVDSQAFFFKLQVLFSQYSETEIFQIAEKLSNIQGYYDNPEKDLWKPEVLDVFTNIMIEALWKTPEENRQELGLLLFQTLQPIVVAFRLLDRFEDTSYSRQIIKPDGLLALRQTLTIRAERELIPTEVVQVFPSRLFIQYLALLKENDSGAYLENIMSLLQQDSRFLKRFFYTFQAQITSTAHSKSYPAPLSKAGFDNLSKYVDIKAFGSLIWKHWGDLSDHKPTDRHDPQTEEVLIRTFQRFWKDLPQEL